MDEYTEKEIKQTIEEGKRFVNLVNQYSKMELVDKGSSLLSMIFLIIIVVSLATISIFCLCMALYHWLQSKTNDPVLSYSIIALALLFLCTLIILLKKSFIEAPVIKMLNRCLSGKESQDSSGSLKSKKDVINRKSGLIDDIKNSGDELKQNLKDSFSPKRNTPTGKKLDFNKLALYAVFAYKGIVWTNKIRRFLGKRKKTKKRR
jgi:hypothetical protein